MRVSLATLALAAVVETAALLLNDSLVDFYLRYLQSQMNEAQRERVHIFNSFFLKQLRSTLQTRRALAMCEPRLPARASAPVPGPAPSRLPNIFEYGLNLLRI